MINPRIYQATESWSIACGHGESQRLMLNWTNGRKNCPSKELRQWFSHDPEKFSEFKTKYIAELDANPKTADFTALIADKLKTTDVILLYGAKDRENNQAVVLKDYIANHLGQA